MREKKAFYSVADFHDRIVAGQKRVAYAMEKRRLAALPAHLRNNKYTDYAEEKRKIAIARAYHRSNKETRLRMREEQNNRKLSEFF